LSPGSISRPRRFALKSAIEFSLSISESSRFVFSWTFVLFDPTS
jgi:hypothetical protein